MDPIERLMQFFRYDHLPQNLQAASKPFCALAENTIKNGPTRGAETMVALRKLLESRDAYVRAWLVENAIMSSPDTDK